MESHPCRVYAQASQKEQTKAYFTIFNMYVYGTSPPKAYIQPLIKQAKEYFTIFYITLYGTLLPTSICTAIEKTAFSVHPCMESHLQAYTQAAQKTGKSIFHHFL
jgi:hypothetical protein